MFTVPTITAKSKSLHCTPTTIIWSKHILGGAKSLFECGTIWKNDTILAKLRVLLKKHTFLEILPAYPLKSPNLFNFREGRQKGGCANTLGAQGKMDFWVNQCLYSSVGLILHISEPSGARRSKLIILDSYIFINILINFSRWYSSHPNQVSALYPQSYGLEAHNHSKFCSGFFFYWAVLSLSSRRISICLWTL